MANNPWKTKSSKYVYKNPWIKVREDQVTMPDGNDGIYGVVEAKLAVGVVALDEENNVYLVGQYRYPTENYSWEIIEGGGEEEESALDTAKRELAEEAGLIAENWQELGAEIHLSNCFSAERGRLFLAQGLRETDKNPDPTEVLTIKKVSLDDCLQMLTQGKITDSLTIIALYRLKLEEKVS